MIDYIPWAITGMSCAGAGLMLLHARAQTSYAQTIAREADRKLTALEDGEDYLASHAASCENARDEMQRQLATMTADRDRWQALHDLERAKRKHTKRPPAPDPVAKAAQMRREIGHV